MLPADVAERIAAGEVIDRPAAVLRELLDNALDAGAREISVELRGGGMELIGVADDGAGIPADEVEVAFRRHATSKIRSFDDLARLESLGFRGEALPSIAAVAEVSLLTRPAPAESGLSLELQGGAVVRRQRAARQPGTTVTVRHLFARVPARRKFLGAARAEASLAGLLLRQYALAHPWVRFSLSVDGRTAFRSRGTGDPRATLADVYGASLAHALHPVAAESPHARVSGFIGGRTTTRPSRQHVTLLVNGRRAATRALLAALEAAYRPLLPRGRHPIALLSLHVPAAEVDPNVHPAKLEVKLLRESEVARLLAGAVREALGRTADQPPEAEEFSLRPGQYSLPRPRRRVAEAGAPGWGAAGSGGADALAIALRTARGLTQLHGALLVAEVEEGLLLVDQHRAHERVIYERLLARQDRALPRGQALLEPVLLELQPHRASLLEPRLAQLQAFGFECERFGGHEFLVRTVPSIPGGHEIASQLPDLLDAAAGEDDHWQARLLATLACRAAVRRGEALEASVLRSLLHELAATTSPAACPHGSPLILHLSARFLERQFGW